MDGYNDFTSNEPTAKLHSVGFNCSRLCTVSMLDSTKIGVVISELHLNTDQK